MKSLANSLLDIALALLDDASMAYPLMRGISRDRERLSRMCENRSLTFFSLDLPHLDSLLLQGLETGRLVCKGPCSTQVSKHIKVPRLFSGLWLRIFRTNGCLIDDPDVNAISFLRQLLVLGKKVQVSCSPDRLNISLENYHDIERKLREPTLDWFADEFDPYSNLRSVHFCDSLDVDLPLFQSESRGEQYKDVLERCQQVADIISESLGFVEPVTFSGARLEEQGRSGFRHGPGAVADRRGNFDKYDMPRWSKKLDNWFPYRECGTIASDTVSVPLNHEVSARLLAVPKTAKGPRLICSEPTEHQWCQQVLRTLLVDRLKANFGQRLICFERQDLSGQMALRSSSSRSLATIDLSDASDRLSCWAVERAFRRNPSLLHCLHACRTRSIRDELSRFPTTIRLKKFASQGTAVTFPVQSIFFLIVALGVNIKGTPSMEKILRLSKSVRVFGDDIIVPNAGYADTINVLELLGLKASKAKSFSNGFFRESCGTDAYKGYDVTPIKPRVVVSDSASSRQALIDTCNNFFHKGYWHASKCIESKIGNHVVKHLPIKRCDEDAVGLSSYSGNRVSHLKSRWNSNLQRFEYRCWVLKTHKIIEPRDERFAFLQYFTEGYVHNNLPSDVLPFVQLSYDSGQDNGNDEFTISTITDISNKSNQYLHRCLYYSGYQNGVARRSRTSDGAGWEPLYSLSRGF